MKTDKIYAEQRPFVQLMLGNGLILRRALVFFKRPIYKDFLRVLKEISLQSNKTPSNFTVEVDLTVIPCGAPEVIFFHSLH